MEENNEHRIEDIKRRLYESKDTLTNRKKEDVIHPLSYNVQSNWKDNSEEKINESISNVKNKKSYKPMIKTFFVFAVIFFIGALGFAAYMFLNNNVTIKNDNIDVNVYGNTFTKGGEELSLQIEIINRNKSNLELANLVVEYPRGAEDNSSDIIRLPKDSIGTIRPGETVNRNVKVVLFGEEKSTRNVKISLEYHPEESNAIFTKEIEYGVTISSSPISILIDSPTEVNSDQPVSFKITTTLNAPLSGEPAILQVVYPNNFVFENAIPEPSLGNSSWDLSELMVSEPFVVTINGKFVGQEGDKQTLNVYVGSPKESNKSLVDVVYNSLLQNISIVKPFLGVKILINGQDISNPSISSGNNVNVDIAWSNNLPTLVSNAKIVAKITGNILNKSSVNVSNGFYNSLNDEIIWDNNTYDELSSIKPGKSGTVEFSFSPISIISSSADVVNPQINVDVSIFGRQPSFGSTFSEVNNFVSKTIKLNSNLQIASVASYNSGINPPKVGVESRFLVTWSLLNTINTVNQAQAKTTLPIYVEWVGQQPGGNEKLIYNEITREVIWNIGTVQPGTGLGISREAGFIVSIKPSLSQVDIAPQLTEETLITGQDSFTNSLVKSKRSPITTGVKVTN